MSNSSHNYPHYKVHVVTRQGGLLMATIVYQTNKKTGVTCAYESTSSWDKEKQQSRAKRTCIGRFDPVSKQIVPTRARKKAVAAAGRKL